MAKNLGLKNFEPPLSFDLRCLGGMTSLKKS
jgi:hypothetical protein